MGALLPLNAIPLQLPDRLGGSDCSTSYKLFIEQLRDMPCWVFRAERPLLRRRGRFAQVFWLQGPFCGPRWSGLTDFLQANVDSANCRLSLECEVA